MSSSTYGSFPSNSRGITNTFTIVGDTKNRSQSLKLKSQNFNTKLYDSLSAHICPNRTMMRYTSSMRFESFNCYNHQKQQLRERRAAVICIRSKCVVKFNKFLGILLFYFSHLFLAQITRQHVRDVFR